MHIKLLVFRVFYYFRIGYTTYLSLPVALFGYITVIYQLLIRNIQSLKPIFPSFAIFFIYAMISIGPIATIFGYIHIKRTQGLKSQIIIDQEVNPFNFRLLPEGTIQREVTFPLTLLSVKLLKKFYETQGILTEEDREEFLRIIGKYERLVKGESLK